MNADLSKKTARQVVGKPFPKGTSGNPGGRPKKFATLLSDAIKSELGEIEPTTKQTYAAVIGAGIVRLVAVQILNGVFSKEALMFLKEAGDRTEGKPAQRIHVEGVSDANPVERTKELIALALERSADQSE